MRNNKKNLLIKAGVSIGFFLFLASFLEGNELLNTFSKIDPLYLFLSFLMVPVMLCTSCLKWKILLDAGGSTISFSRLISIYLVGYFFSNLLPSTVGGDVVRSFYAGKEINNLSYSTATVFIERFSGILFLLVLVILAPLARPSLYGSLYLILPAIVSFILLCVMVMIWRMKDSPFWRRPFISRFICSINEADTSNACGVWGKCRTFGIRSIQILFVPLEKFSIELRKALIFIRHDRILLCKIVILTILFYFLTWVNVYMAFLAFDSNVKFLAIIALVPTIMFVAHLPVTLLGNLGFFESVFIFYFLLIGLPGEETLAMGLLLRVKMLLLGGIGFVVYWSYRQAWGHPAAGQDKQANLEGGV